MKRHLFDFIIIVVVTGLLVALLDVGAYFYLAKKGDQNFFPVLHFAKLATAEDIKAGATLRKLDPLLGYAHDAADYELLPENSEFSEGFLDYNPKCSDCRHLVALGGSTTDGIIALQYYQNWPYALQNKLREQKVQVFNGGVGGFSTSQELFKLIRDGLMRKPTWVVSMDGVNETFRLDKYPYLTGYQYELYEAFKNKTGLLPNLRYLFSQLYGKSDFIFHGSESHLKDYERWEKNIRMMHAICKEFNVEYVTFLQPIYGVGRYVGTQQEIDNFKNRGTLYRETIKHFYEKAKEFCRQASYCHDISHVFEPYEGKGKPIYFDPRHPNTYGNQIIADKVFEAMGFVDTHH